MKIRFAILVGLFLCLLFTSLAAPAAQAPARVQVQKPVTHSVECLALTFAEGKAVSVKLKGTDRLPPANGEAKVERKRGTTEIEIELDEMKPATLFGGDYSAYVLWSVSPEGQASNLGELIIQGNRSKLNVSTRLETFGMIITAEPHFLVKKPSRFIILTMVRPTDNLKIPFKTAKLQYRGEDGIYRSERESLVNAPEAKSEVRTELEQARIAVKLAERAQAEQFAADKLAKARAALQKTEEAVRGGVKQEQTTQQAHEAVRFAAEAQQLAEVRGVEAALAAERQAEAEKQQSLEKEKRQAQAETARAEAERLKAELAQAQEAQRRAEAEAARQRAQAGEERAQRAAEAARRAEEEARRAEEDARRNTEAARKAEEEARMNAERAEREKAELRAKLLAQFNSILPTQDTDRGLVVNIGDVLFDTGKYTLRQEAKEKLARFSGMVLNYPELQIQSEGHTDSTGSAEFNQKLSEQRAGAVKEYLIAQGIAAEKVTSIGRGFSVPVESNDTAAGRKKNRRVELIISGEVIGSKVGKSQ